jgi:hypothetical protein
MALRMHAQGLFIDARGLTQSRKEAKTQRSLKAIDDAVDGLPHPRFAKIDDEAEF